MSLRSVSFQQTIPAGPFYRLGLQRYLRRPFYLIFLLGVGFLTVSTVWLEGGMPDRLSFLFPAFVVLLVMPLLHLWGLRYLLTTNVTLRGPHTVKANEEGVYVEGEGFYSFLAWSTFAKYKLYNNWLLLFVSGTSAVYLYLPAMEDVSDQEILKALVKGELGGA